MLIKVMMMLMKMMMLTKVMDINMNIKMIIIVYKILKKS